MIFTVTTSIPTLPSTNCAFLHPDNWDDWFSFETLFHLVVFDESGQKHVIGQVKIGQTGLAARRWGVEPTVGVPSRTPLLAHQFESLPEGYFSLGVDENYYEGIRLLSAQQQAEIFWGLRDCAFDLGIFVRHENEEVMQQSLLRHIDASNVRNRLHRLAHGNPALTEFRFSYTFPVGSTSTQQPTMDFHVQPNSQPPTNVHVLIGRNGVGKTRCMKGLTRAVCELYGDDAETGQLFYVPDGLVGWRFSGLVSVSFSAFDSFDLLNTNNSTVRIDFVGLRAPQIIDDVEQLITKTPENLTQDFCISFERCRSGPRARRWQESVEELEVDRLFGDAHVTSILDQSDEHWRHYAEDLFDRLSSGHKIVLFTITRLVELVDEKTLVLIDEPEGHLHPPLLAAFIRSLNSLLIKRNGVAIIATHSPVVLQEVPRSSSWKLQRSGHVSRVERPSIETFGENVGVLTREVFNLDVTDSGFHKMISDVIEQNGYSYEQLLEHFSGQLGAEACAIARALISERAYQQGQA